MEPGEITEYTSLKDGLDKKNDSDDEESQTLNNQDLSKPQTRSKYENLKTNILMIYDSIQNKEIYMPLIFFIVTGFMVPNYDDVTYYFLLNFCQISHQQYTYLAMNQSLGVIIGLIVYVKYLKNVEVWKLILASLCFNFLVNTIQYLNFLRINVNYFGIGDLPVNAFIMLVGSGTQTSLSVVPMTVMMMNVIPANIEASMFAFITAILTFSTDWGG